MIALDERGNEKDGSIGLEYALRALSVDEDGKENCHLAASSVQACIHNRIQCFPQYAFAMMHTTPCIVPRNIAKLLMVNPALISFSINSFCKSENREKKDIQIISAMNKFGSQLGKILPCF